MKSIFSLCLVFCALLCSDVVFIDGATQADYHKQRTRGDYKLLRACYEGKLSLLTTALQNSANVNAVLTKEIGEKYLKLGKAGVDFIVAPALHVAISRATFDHLKIVQILLREGANPHAFFMGNDSEEEYYPAIMYALGAAKPMDKVQAGMLESLLMTFPKIFNDDTLKQWLDVSGYPSPLLAHTMENCFDVVYVLATTGAFNINIQDNFGLTALHIASWLGNSNIVLLLLHNGANARLTNRYGRNFMHYLAINGFYNIILSVIKLEKLGITEKLHVLLTPDVRNDSVLSILSNSVGGSEISRSILNLLYAEDIEKNYTQAYTTMNTIISQSQLSNRILVNANISTCQNIYKNSVLFKYREVYGNGHAIKQEEGALTLPQFQQKYYQMQEPVVLKEFSRVNTMKININKLLLESDEYCYIHKKFTSFHKNLTGNAGLSTLAPHECASTQKYNNQSETASEKRRFTSVRMNEVSKANFDDIFDDNESLATLAPSLCQLRYDDVVTNIEQISGGSRALHGKPFQIQSAFWNYYINSDVPHAKRLWILIPPGHSLNIFFYNLNITSARSSVALEYILKKYGSSSLSGSRFAYYATWQDVGDIIYVPHSWGSLMLSEFNGADISQYFCIKRGKQTIATQTPISYRMYGHIS